VSLKSDLFPDEIKTRPYLLGSPTSQIFHCVLWWLESLDFMEATTSEMSPGMLFKTSEHRIVTRTLPRQYGDKFAKFRIWRSSSCTRITVSRHLVDQPQAHWERRSRVTPSLAVLSVDSRCRIRWKIHVRKIPLTVYIPSCCMQRQTGRTRPNSCFLRYPQSNELLFHR
jgi:hypothetical protein